MSTNKGFQGWGPLLLFLLLLLISVSTLHATPTDFWLIHPWEMWAGTPAHNKLCKSNGHCYSLKVLFPSKDIIQYQDNDRWSILSIIGGTSIGITYDYGDNMLRCFSDNPNSCTPLIIPFYPPGHSPLNDIIPVLSQPAITSPTPGAQVYYSLKTEYVNYVDTVTCVASSIGSIVHSGSHFLLTSYDFGSPTNTLNNIYVTEEYMGCPVTTLNPSNCQRLERYFFAPNLGRIRQEGWNDPLCDGINPETCLGSYIIPSPGVESWSLSSEDPVPFPFTNGIPCYN